MFAARKTDNVSSAANYIEDVFSTWLYAGTGSSQTITNNIDTSTKGGLVWIKGRSGATGHRLTDTVRGATKALVSNDNSGEATESTGLTAFGTTGFTIGADANYNTNAATYVSWTFREQAKFFDVVTYTGNGSATRSISHSLGSAPGCVIVKQTGAAQSWLVWHRTFSIDEYLVLNSTAVKDSFTNVFPTVPDASNFFVGNGGTNTNGATYVAYLFAHDAGGFGATGSDNVISCGSFTTNGSGNATVTLGYEPQFIIYKGTNINSNWNIWDVIRGMSYAGYASLSANITNAESSGIGDYIHPIATGFEIAGGGFIGANQPGIYIAIRRGPMKTPTSGTSVFNTRLRTSNGTNSVITGVGFPPDAIWGKVRNSSGARPVISSKLTGTLNALYTDLTNAESGIDAYNSFNMDGFTIGSGSTLNTSPNTYVHHCFRRAPGFFDIVCYTGTGSNRTVTHNLGVAPELMLVKRRDTGNAWAVYANNDNTDYLVLNATDATVDDNTYWNDTSPTASVFSVGTNTAVNTSASTYIAYLFATLTGVSKVGSYTGSGTTKQIDCGFTAGARYVFIKRVDSTGDWYVWDSERGIVAGNDPYLLINKLDAEVTNTDYIDPLNAGFEISSTAPAAINANGGTFIFLAIA